MSSVSRVASGLTFTKITRQTNNYNKVLSAINAKVYVPGGFPYEAFNGLGYIKPWSITRLVESSRAAAFNKPDDKNTGFLDASRLHDSYLFFIASTSTKIFPELYDMSVKKAPLELDIKLDYVGNRAYKLQTTISVQGASSPLCINNTQAVSVSKDTRTPLQLPEWWKEKYSSVKGEPLKISRLNVPENVTFTNHRLQAQASDTDAYMHVNWTSFVKYCYDAFVISEFQKNPEIVPQNLFRNMKHFSACYIKEASLGDNISIRYWQDPVVSNLYNFQVQKESDVICECSAEFF
uniref:Uncharacterized protein n=1 Tax=Arion vulgaris TaxID=1028688 RepID=A0A0B7A8F3_9EUPU